MDHIDKKLKFIEAMTKHGLNHFAGGFAGGLGDTLGVTSGFNAAGPSSDQINSSLTQSNAAIQGTQNLANMALPGATTGFGNQNALASQLLAMTQGQGPNPAQNQLAQATGANVANQAALMAGQRGSAANAGLLARQAAMQGANTQQQAAGQAATLGAQQQIAAQNNLANLSAQQVGQAGQAQGLFATSAGNQLNTLENANAAANSTNANTAGANAATNKGLLGSVVGGIAGAFGLAEGGKIKKMADGGLTSEPIQAPAAQQSWIGGYLSGGPMASSQAMGNDTSFQDNFKSGEKAGKGAIGAIGKLFGPVGGSIGAPGASDVIDSGGLSEIGALAAKGGEMGRVRDFTKGGIPKAEKASEKKTHAGNSYADDKIPAMVQEGEVVIDNDTMNDPGPIGQMARTLRQHIEQRNKRK